MSNDIWKIFRSSQVEFQAVGGGGGRSGSVIPCTASQSSVGTISIASHGQPSRNAPSGPLLVHFWQPMQRYGSTSIRPNGGWSSSEIQNMQASIGQYSMQAGEPAQPVQQSVVMARMRGRFLRWALPSPTDIGHSFSTISNTFVYRSRPVELRF